MALNLIEYATVGPDVVVIKFARTVKISSLVNANFIVETSSLTPTVIPNPFKSITTLNDYNQISRLLKLYWSTVLQGQQEYYIRVNGLVDAANQIIPEEKIKFTIQDSATPSSIANPKPPVIEQILVEDQSILAQPYTTYQIIAKNPDFYITSVEPENGDFYLENDYNDGRVIIYFNERPASNFLNTRYFKAQRKKIQRTPSRWETISANVSLHSWKPEVYIDFPSLNDATPSYFTSEKEYFESGYKYRIIVSENVGI